MHVYFNLVKKSIFIYHSVVFIYSHRCMEFESYSKKNNFITFSFDVDYVLCVE